MSTDHAEGAKTSTIAKITQCVQVVTFRARTTHCELECL